MRMDLGNSLNYGDEFVRTCFNKTKKELGFCKSASIQQQEKSKSSCLDRNCYDITRQKSCYYKLKENTLHDLHFKKTLIVKYICREIKTELSRLLQSLEKNSAREVRGFPKFCQVAANRLQA